MTVCRILWVGHGLTDRNCIYTGFGQDFQDLSDTITPQDLLVTDVFTVGRPDRSDPDIVGPILDGVLGFFD